MDQRDHECSSGEPANRGERHADLMPGHRQSVLLGNDLRHAQRDRKCKQVSDEKEERAGRLQALSVSGGEDVVDDAVDALGDLPPQLGVRDFEGRQQPVGVSPRGLGQHLELLTVDRSREAVVGDATSADITPDGLAAKALLPAFADVVERIAVESERANWIHKPLQILSHSFVSSGIDEERSDRAPVRRKRVPQQHKMGVDAGEARFE